MTAPTAADLDVFESRMHAGTYGVTLPQSDMRELLRLARKGLEADALRAGLNQSKMLHESLFAADEDIEAALRAAGAPAGGSFATRIRALGRSAKAVAPVGIYDIQSGGEGTFIVRSDDGKEWARIAKFIPGEYTAADESILGNADTLADALLGLRYGNEDGDPLESNAPPRFCDHAAEPCDRCEAVRTALRAAGRLP